MVAMAFQQPGEPAAPAAEPLRPAAEPAQPAPGAAPGDQAAPAGQPGATDEADFGGVLGPVQIEFIEGLDVIVLRGNRRDVERLQRIIGDIERLSQETLPLIEIHRLSFVGSQVMAQLVSEIYNEILSPRQGVVTIRPLVKPNAMLLIGRTDSVNIVRELIIKLDQPVAAESQFEVFQLKHISALDAQETISAFFVDRFTQAQVGTQASGLRPGLGTRVNVVADYRSNQLIIQASARDMDEVRRLITRIDVETSGATNELKIFRLKNALASDIAPVLQDALNWQLIGNRTPVGATTTGFGAGVGQAEERARIRSAILTFTTVDSEGGKLLESGLLSEVRVTADVNGNALIVTGPSKSMGLIAALVKELDTLPSAQAQIKVFTIVNGDATSLSSMLQQLLSQTTQGAQQLGGLFGQGALNPFLAPSLQAAAASGEGTLVPVRFRGRPADQQHYRHRLRGRSGRGRGDSDAAGRTESAQTADGRLLAGQRARHRSRHRRQRLVDATHSAVPAAGSDLAGEPHRPDQSRDHRGRRDDQQLDHHQRRARSDRGDQAGRGIARPPPAAGQDRRADRRSLLDRLLRIRGRVRHPGRAAVRPDRCCRQSGRLQLQQCPAGKQGG
jgi:general secretion pathway protein D